MSGLAQALAEALEPENGWYADFTAGGRARGRLRPEAHAAAAAYRISRYRRGDEAGRAEAIAYRRSVGTPEHQLDWEE
ncbi:hypothetical protein [Streptomyces sp. NPDC001137]|uniref:hypothetical protein n=1 Tax=Streptomyces sp. NPDC001137 TaxID=3154378 RepID=UPI00331D3F9D